MTYNYTNEKKQTYYLHGKEVELRGGRKQKIYYFAKEVKEKQHALNEMPAGYEVVENKRTGLPLLRKAS